MNNSKIIIYGVGLLLFAPSGKIFVLRELVSKPQINKEAGMISIPFETTIKGESHIDTLQRLIYEEIGEELNSKPVFFKKFLIKASQTHSIEIFVYTASTTNEFIAHPHDNDIIHYGWLTPRELLNIKTERVRQEVNPILTSYLS